MGELDAFYAAAFAGDANAMSNLEERANREYSILHFESSNGNLERVRFILREFANTNTNLLTKTTSMTKQTALHMAIFWGNTEVAEVLIEAARRQLSETSFKAFLRQRDDDMNTALHLAVKKGSVASVKLLVEADPSDTHIQNKRGETPMYIAVEQELNDIVEIISTTCIAPSLDGPDGSAALRINNPDQVESPGGTLYEIMDRDAFYAAAIAGNAVAIAKLEKEADLLKDDNKTILHIESKNGNTEPVRFILREFANKNLLPKLTTIFEHTALHLAIFWKHTEVAKVIIKAARKQLPVSSLQDFLRQCDKNMDTALHAAVMRRNVAIVKLLVEADPTHRHTQNNEGKTPIYIAAVEGYTDIVKVICTTCTAPLNFDGPGGSTALHDSVKRDHDIELVEDLIDAARRLPSASDNDNTGFNRVGYFQASSSLDIDSTDDDDDDSTCDRSVTSFKAFLRRGDNDSTCDHSVISFQAFLRRGDKDLNSALHIAVMQGNLAMATLLVESDPSNPGTQNNKGETPLYIAAERGYFSIVEMICIICAVPFNLAGPGGKLTVLHAVIEKLDEAKNEVSRMIKIIFDALTYIFIRKDVDGSGYYIYRQFAKIFSKTDEYGQTILELAVERNYVEVVKLILTLKSPAFDKTGKDGISLMPLIYKAKDNKHENMVEVLSYGYEVGAKSVAEDQYSLISAITRREAETVFSLLDGHAERLVTFVDNLGWTALHYAAYHEFRSIINRIVEEQKRFGYVFEYQDMLSTPFHVSAERGYTSIVILLMQIWPSSSSAYINVDNNGQNILHLAAMQSKKQMIQGILKYCPEEQKNEFVNKQDNDGNTPLHLLMRRGCLVPEFLRYEGLNTSVKNKEKLTPLDMLYVQKHIIDDQVKIKVALDHFQIDRKRDIFSSSVFTASERESKDVNFRKAAQQMIDGKLALMKDDTRAVAKCFADAIAGDPISRAALEIEADTLNEARETILHVESKKGVVENVRFIASALANKNLLDKLDNQKQTALYLAAHHGHTQVVKALLDAARRNLPSASANDHNHNSVSSFQDLTRQDNIPNYEGKTPIYIAAEKGYKEIVEEICTTCTALSLDGPDGRTTALHAVIQNIGQVTEGASDMVRMIINAAKRWSSADFEAFFCRIDELESTVLQLAVEKNCVDAVRVILQEDPAYQPGREIRRNGLMRLIYKAIDKGCSDDIVQLLSQTYKVGIKPDHKDVLELILAIKRRDEDSVLGFLRGAKDLVTFTEDNGCTALHYAVYHEFDSVLGAIIGAQEDAGHQFVYEDTVPTPFHVAVECGYTSTLIQLMQLWPVLPFASKAHDKSPYTVVNKDGRNILHLAAAYNSNTKDDIRKEMVEGILKYCPKMYKDKLLKQQDTNDDTPLHLLISHGCFIPELITDEGLDIMAKNKDDFTPWEMLYFKNDVIADQVLIKIAIDRVQTNQSAWNLVWNLCTKSTEKKNDIWKDIPHSKRRTKDVIFKERKKLLMDADREQKKKDLDRYKMRTNTQIIVAALITTITFTVGFTMPGGLHQSGEVDEGLVLLSRKKAFNAFMVSDALALLLSTSSLFFYFLESMNEDLHQVSKLNTASSVLNIISVVAMMLTFIAGTYLVLSHSPTLAIIVCIIGSLFFLLIIILLIMIGYDRLYVKRNLY